MPIRLPVERPRANGARRRLQVRTSVLREVGQRPWPQAAPPASVRGESGTETQAELETEGDTVTATLSTRTRWLALINLCVGDLMIVVDTTVVNVALPSIRNDLGFS